MAEVIPQTPVPPGYQLRSEQLVPAGQAATVRLARGEVFQLIDVEGQQVADLMAWRLADPAEAFSPAHTVSCLTRLVPREGDQLFSTRRRPLLGLRRDTVGRHDLVVPCCDPERYQLDFGLDDHPSCLSSIQAALTASAETWTARGELAWNVFMHNTITPDGHLVTEEPTHGPGAHLELEALDDLGLVASSCPQDLTPCNAWNITPVAFRIFTKG
ncbi:MAG TPA: urea carboxylase-associated family protein [Actinomycetota bacterium]